ncbi:hypothetical protein NDI76_15995 [Halogeometricum sp. S1BR25-6]|uniref:Uncharacterized protein n=1 Tax=Halogeometricum salsisoli TaxID=2950536 RepID=A0ABU2GJA4_9EURY|nr:hypothetical protein [Halogeometricum sp. S1BR25-6]MDS0300249.1 hypothetical protein [Halogeometricum sp. S1BR25-6]
MAKNIRVDEEFHAYVESHNRDGETMGETLRRLTRGPDPNEIAGVLSEESADRMETAIEDLSGAEQGPR